MVEINEIKKGLYKQNPDANMLLADSDGVHYETSLEDGTVIFFSVPFNDMGNARFYKVMKAKYLIRWINN